MIRAESTNVSIGKGGKKEDVGETDNIENFVTHLRAVFSLFCGESGGGAHDKSSQNSTVYVDAPFNSALKTLIANLSLSNLSLSIQNLKQTLIQSFREIGERVTQTDGEEVLFFENYCFQVLDFSLIERFDDFKSNVERWQTKSEPQLQSELQWLRLVIMHGKDLVSNPLISKDDFKRIFNVTAVEITELLDLVENSNKALGRLDHFRKDSNAAALKIFQNNSVSRKVSDASVVEFKDEQTDRKVVLTEFDTILGRANSRNGSLTEESSTIIDGREKQKRLIETEKQYSTAQEQLKKTTDAFIRRRCRQVIIGRKMPSAHRPDKSVKQLTEAFQSFNAKPGKKYPTINELINFRNEIQKSFVGKSPVCKKIIGGLLTMVGAIGTLIVSALVVADIVSTGGLGTSFLVLAAGVVLFASGDKQAEDRINEMMPQPAGVRAAA